MDSGEPVGDAAFLGALGALGSAVLAAVTSMEQAARHMHPPRIETLRRALAPLSERVEDARTRLLAEPAPDATGELVEVLVDAADHARRSVDLFVDATPSPDAVARILGAMHEHCRAQDALFALRGIPPVNRWFLEPPLHERLAEFEDDDGALFSAANAFDERGGFTLFVPERRDGTSHARPLVVALHGGMGHGADFIWTWLREARSRDFLLLAPTSRGPTWSFNGPDHDRPALHAMLDTVLQRHAVDPDRILLTGLSDGATYALLCGLGEGSPFTALAPVSGVLHPANLANGNLARARGRRIRLVHGALDWMFPVQVARSAAEVLRDAGAEIVYREIADLSHAYPREENAAILEWFDPGLALA